MPPAFQLEQVSYDYEGIPAIHELSLSIEHGERVALVGANGSGKSTLLRILDGLYFAPVGSVRFDGEILTAERLRADGFGFAFRRRVALVLQNPDAQLFNPTVFDEVAYAPLQLQWKREDVLRRVADTLSLMALDALRDRPPYRLSGGEKKRVALASVLVLDPEVLLLDEPTAALDPRSQGQLIDLIQQWKGTNKTIVTATHQLDILEDIADRVIVLDGGRVLASGTPAEILVHEELLLKANLIHAHRHSHGGITHSHAHTHRHSHGAHEHEH